MLKFTEGGCDKWHLEQLQIKRLAWHSKELAIDEIGMSGDVQIMRNNQFVTGTGSSIGSTVG